MEVYENQNTTQLSISRAKIVICNHAFRSIDLKIDNLDRVCISTKILATFDVDHPVNIDKISTALHVLCLLLQFKC